MAGTFGVYWQQQILSHIADGTVFTQQTLWVALSTSTFWTAAGSDFAGEPGGAAYARYGINTGLWSAVVSGAIGSSGCYILNSTQFTFAQPTSNWGTIGYIALCNTSTSGQGYILAWCTAANARTVLTGDTVLVGTGSLQLQVT